MAILDAACALFIAHGYEGTSIDMIAEKAEVSRQTIYNGFTSKEDLFLAMVNDAIRQILMPVLTPDQPAQSLRQALHVFGKGILELTMSADAIALQRLVIVEALRFPQLGAALFYDGVERVERELASFLQTHRQFTGKDSRLAARLFLSMVTRPSLFQVQLGIVEYPDQTSIDTHLDATIDLFLHGVAAQTG
ncbi:TetR/AcrR family transcriptional regulator [Allorhizobium sonneratiae]|uniref:TetR/AcrR family transcriptional regulator n=1 Tax=Allorhizobium sonneratiae TaxID=2934936 RepID=UPI002033CEE8|nr:TetR/AcrR family transcriptional regulator [Allorhizobium sonneratiae]